MKYVKTFENYNIINENNSVENEFSDTVKDFLKDCSVYIEDIEKATYHQINDMHHNASASGVYYTDRELIFTSKNTLQNWMYYAGYEYITTENMTDNPSILDDEDEDEFVAVYTTDVHDRIENDINTLNGF